MELCCVLKPFAKCFYCEGQWCRYHWIDTINDHQSNVMWGGWTCPVTNIDLTWDDGVSNPGLLVRDWM